MPNTVKQHQFLFDGNKLTLNTNIGDLEYFNSDTDAIDKFEAYKIDIKLPSEHYLTNDGLTKRCVVEMQIYHKLTSRQNIIVNHNFSPVNVKRAVLSVLFVAQEDEFGDRFFQEMGVTQRNTNKEGELNIPKENEYLKDSVYPPASYSVGFDYLAFQGLMNLLGGNKGIYFYYGSETVAPCKEDIVWMVYKEPRAISLSQLDFLMKMLVKKDKNGNYKGNNREIVRYNEIKRGFIKYAGNAVRKMGQSALFQKYLK